MLAEISFLDFDLRFERIKTGYRARVVGCPALPVASDFTLPFSDEALENYLLKIGRPRRDVRGFESREIELAKDFGRQLFDAAFGREILSCLRQSLDEAARQDKGLRLRLNLTDAPELADLPWEYLYESQRNLFFALFGKTPIVRYLDIAERIQPLAVQPPLKILVMISAPSGASSLDTGREWTNLTQALADLQSRGLVTLDRLDTATLPELQRRLRKGQYHIFHFIGHGAFIQQAEGGALLLEDDQGGARAVGGQELGWLLRNHPQMRLALLNACEGGRASRSDPFAGAAQSLVQQGLPAVIAMQFEISDQAAITFTREFYGALADGYPVDAALTEARLAIFVANDNGLEWGTPVLYMRAPDGRIFDVERLSATPQLSAATAPTPPAAAQEAGQPSKPVIRLPDRSLSTRVAITLASLLLVMGMVFTLYMLRGQIISRLLVSPTTSLSEISIQSTGTPIASSTQPSPAPSAMATTPSVAPAVRAAWVWQESEIPLLEFVVEPGTTPTQAITDLLRIDQVVMGSLDTGQPVYDVRLLIHNTDTEAIRLALNRSFFALEDRQGGVAPLLYFCCAAAGDVLAPGQEREVQLVFEELSGWRSKGGPGGIQLRVRGFLPILDAAWAMPTLDVKK